MVTEDAENAKVYVIFLREEDLGRFGQAEE